MGLGPIFGAKIGLGVEGVSYFMAIFLLGSLALQIAISRLSDKYDRRGVLIGVAVASAVACAASDSPLDTRYMAHPGDKLCHRRSKRRRLSDRDGACERPCKPGSHGLDYGRTVARLWRRRQHQSFLRRARDEMGGTRRIVPILCRDLRVACRIYPLSTDAPRSGARDD